MSYQGKAITSSATIPTKWKTDVPNYARVRYQSIYPGVDLIYYGNQGQLEYDFLVAPGTDPKAITLNVESSDLRPRQESSTSEAPLRIDHNGDLVIGVNGEEIRFHEAGRVSGRNGRFYTIEHRNSKIHRGPLRSGVEESGGNSIGGL